MDELMNKILEEDLSDIFHSEADPNGSYTGNPTDGGKPVQDADDL